MLGLGLMGLEDLGPGLARWWGVHLLWATLGGAAIGAASGHGRGAHGGAPAQPPRPGRGLDEFLGLGLIGMAYGLAQMSLASGFLAVFAAGLALQRVREGPPPVPQEHRRLARTHRCSGAQHHAGDMQDAVQVFNEQLEKVAELALVLMVGAMLRTPRRARGLVVRAAAAARAAAAVGARSRLPGEGLTRPQQTMIGWFGIRGIGSVFYLLFALHHGLPPRIAETLVSLTLWTVAARSSCTASRRSR